MAGNRNPPKKKKKKRERPITLYFVGYKGKRVKHGNYYTGHQNGRLNWTGLNQERPQSL